MDQSKPDASVRAKAAALWTAKTDRSAESELLQRVVRTFALVDPRARELAERCAKPKTALSLPAQPWLADAKTAAFLAKNMRLWYGRWLAQNMLFEEALQQLEGLQPEEVVDPASLLFYQGVVYHRLLNRDAGIDAITRLLDASPQAPKRYTTVAQLIEADLKDLKTDSLDHIARRMEDIQRRLDLGRAGPKVRNVEEGVIKSLDKLINQLEAMQKQQQASASGSIKPGNPAQDSTPMGGKGPGNVTKRDVGHQSGWGNIAPKQRDEALQQIGRDFPPHYRDIIEQYFRRLASEGSQSSP